MSHSSAFVLVTRVEFWFEMHVTGLCCYVGVVRNIIHARHKKDKAERGCGACLMQTPSFKEEAGGSERESDFLEATQLLNDRAGTGAQIRWPPAVMLSLSVTPLLSHVDRHGPLRRDAGKETHFS